MTPVAANQRMAVPNVALMDIGDVDFYHRLAYKLDGVQHRDGGKGKAGRIDDDCRILPKGLLQPVEHHAFAIGLAKVTFQAKIARQGRGLFLDLVQEWEPRRNGMAMTGSKSAAVMQLRCGPGTAISTAKGHRDRHICCTAAKCCKKSLKNIFQLSHSSYRAKRHNILARDDTICNIRGNLCCSAV
jgi:hypothetical protein